MSASLHLVDAETGEIHDQCPNCRDLAAEIVGMRATVASQAAMIGRLKGKLEAQDPEAHPRHKEIVALIDRWRVATQHPRSRQSKDRFDVIRARLSDGYDVETLECAIDGIGAFPYVRNGQRVREGNASERHDSLSIALKGGENTERFANLGHKARKAGYVTWGEF